MFVEIESQSRNWSSSTVRRKLAERMHATHLALVTAALLAATPLSNAATRGRPGAQSPPYGIVVMAHGGNAAWNGRIEEAVASVDAGVPVRIAFGMADRASLEAAVGELETEGVRRIAVVRLFVSGESFLQQTEYLLGLDPEIPPFLFDSAAGGGHHHPVPDPAAAAPIEHRSAIALSAAGLVDDPFSGRILAERALALSERPGDETVLVIAHGMGDEESNERLLQALQARADTVRNTAPFRAVEVVALREDWEEARAPAEARIRDIVERGAADGRVIVLPFRVAGFGPYAEVLEGYEYAADGLGLLPHDGMAEWIVATAERMACVEGWITTPC
jgi:hypothetical protein